MVVSTDCCSPDSEDICCEGEIVCGRIASFSVSSGEADSSVISGVLVVIEDNGVWDAAASVVGEDDSRSGEAAVGVTWTALGRGDTGSLTPSGKVSPWTGGVVTVAKSAFNSSLSDLGVSKGCVDGRAGADTSVGSWDFSTTLTLGFRPRGTGDTGLEIPFGNSSVTIVVNALEGSLTTILSVVSDILSILWVCVSASVTHGNSIKGTGDIGSEMPSGNSSFFISHLSTDVSVRFSFTLDGSCSWELSIVRGDGWTRDIGLKVGCCNFCS